MGRRQPAAAALGRLECENFHVTRTARRLPHIYLLGRPLFVTFRLHDTLPPPRAFPSPAMTSGKAFVAMDRILDQARCGPSFLRRAPVAQQVLDSIQYGADRGDYKLHAWVIMPNHVHLLLTPETNVSKLLGSLKGGARRRLTCCSGGQSGPFGKTRAMTTWSVPMKNSGGYSSTSNTIPSRRVSSSNLRITLAQALGGLHGRRRLAPAPRIRLNLTQIHAE